jgi:hypothetical protein
MADIEQLPGELNITTTADDDLSVLLDFDVVLTGYTFVAKVEHYQTTTTITVTNTDLAAGKITISLTNTQLTAIGAGIHKWYLNWTTGTTDRRVLAGTFTIQNYP